MNKEFIPYEQALALKELGFDYITFEYFDNESKNICDVIKELPAPLYQQAFRFFREKYGLHTEFFINDDKTFAYMISFFIEETRIDKPILWGFATYEEAEIECINHLIKITNENL